MISRFPFAGHLPMSLLLAAEYNSAAADERGLHLAVAKAANGGAAWDRSEISKHARNRVALSTTWAHAVPEGRGGVNAAAGCFVPFR